LRISNRIVKDALSYIQQNYNHAISLTQLSEQLLITPNYLSRLFKEKTGNSFTDHVTQQRIEAAKNMLRSGQFKVYEVAEKIGYSDQQYFSKQFKKLTGVTPTQYANSKIR
jgi:two-component system response regulator YesN